jgi:(p)ppGpp synthase/HD superfamily hydrolase
MRSILDELGMSDTDELFKKVGLGERHAPLVSKILLENPSTDSSGTTISSPLTIAGTENLIISYARCCHPIPGDAIMGYLSTGRGIIVHRTVCGNLSEFRKQPDKWVAVNWEETIEHEFSAEITTEILNQPGALAEIAARIGDTGSNIEQVSINDRQEKEYADLTFLILVRDRIHLARVIRRIRSMQVVKKISRSCA